MGTGMLATLTHLHAGDSLLGAWGSRMLVVVGWSVAVTLTVAFARRIRQDPGVWRNSVTGVGAAAWGMVSMGILAIGSATGAIVPAWSAESADVARAVFVACWSLGTLIGLISTFGFSVGLVRRRPPDPRPSWGLAVVPPMVSATTGATLTSELGLPGAFIDVLMACFVCSLVLGGIIFTIAYRHHAVVEEIPVALAPTAWVPLGVVGQSSAAAVAIAGLSVERLGAPHWADTAGVGYAAGMLGLGVPLSLFAVILTVRGFVRRMPFSPVWWSLTFPIGTLSLGSLYLSRHLPAMEHVSVAIWMVLMGTWTLCATASLRSLRGGV